MRPSKDPLLSTQTIEARVGELAGAISRDYEGRELTLVVVLKGAVFFAADLIKRLTVPVRLVFVRARSYQDTESTGRVELTGGPGDEVAGRHVLVVEDILDTGRTCTVLLERLRAAQPATLALCTLLDKPSRRVTPVEADYVGFAIDNLFVVGYGLDFNEEYRDLKAVHLLEE